MKRIYPLVDNVSPQNSSLASKIIRFSSRMVLVFNRHSITITNSHYHKSKALIVRPAEQLGLGLRSALNTQLGLITRPLEIKTLVSRGPSFTPGNLAKDKLYIYDSNKSIAYVF